VVGGPAKEGTALRRTIIPDTDQKFIEVVAAAELLEPLVLHGKALDDSLNTACSQFRFHCPWFFWESLFFFLPLTLTAIQYKIGTWN